MTDIISTKRLSEKKLYALRSLPNHLSGAGLFDDLYTLLTNGLFLQEKILSFKTFNLVADFSFNKSTNPVLVDLLNFLKQNAHIFDKCVRDIDLASTFYCQIFGIPQLQKLLEILNPTLPVPYIYPRHRLPETLLPLPVWTFVGHKSAISDCAVSGKRQIAISASVDGTLKVWDYINGMELFTLYGHNSAITACGISKNGLMAVSGDVQGTLIAWELQTGQKLYTQKCESPIKCCAINDDCSIVVSAEGTLKSGTNGRGYISEDCVVRIFDGHTGSEKFIISGLEDLVMDCSISDDGNLVVAGLWGGSLKTWSGLTGDEIFTIPNAHLSYVSSCAVNSSGNRIVSAGYDHLVKLWDAATGKLIFKLSGHGHFIPGCTISSDGNTIASVDKDGLIKIWDGASGKEIFTIPGHSSVINSCAMTDNGKFLVTGSGGQIMGEDEDVDNADDYSLKVWDLESIKPYQENPHIPFLNTCSISEDGNMIVVGGRHGMDLYDGVSGKHKYSEGILHVNGCGISKNKRIVVTVSDEYVSVWDNKSVFLRDREITYEDEHLVNACAVSENGRVIVYVTGRTYNKDNRLSVWDWGKKEIRISKRGHDGPITCCDLLNGQFIVSGSYDKTLKVWNYHNGREIVTLFGHSEKVNDCIISNDGKMIVSASDDRTIKVWDWKQSKALLTLRGHTASVRAVALNSTKTLIASVSWDKTIRIWNAKTSECLVVLHVNGGLNGLDITPNNKYIVACGDFGVYSFILHDEILLTALG